MGGQVNWRQPITGADLLRQIEKRTLHTERRPTVHDAADLLGPGIAPYAVEILDWNSDDTSFNGFWFSQPGAINSPDPTNSRWWMGWSEATEDGFGLQQATEFNQIAGNAWPPQTWLRRFFDPGAGTRSYSRWALVSDSRYVGEPMMWISETPPNDRYQFADGRLLSRTLYPDLFLLCQSAGFPWGIGDGATTFNLADMRSRFPMGSDSAISGREPGMDEGLTVPEDRTPRHSHTVPEQGTSASNPSGTGGVFSPQQVNYEHHDHGGSTGLSATADMPRLRWAFHIRVLP